ncbi:hypothetical protein GW17_00021543 [Ensete ventricosum]|nr:hypothetical protein GW17_00021543 [Ensete ventricosum]
MTTTKAGVGRLCEGRAPQATVVSPEAPSMDRPPPSELPPGGPHRKRAVDAAQHIGAGGGKHQEREGRCERGECVAAWDEAEELSAAASHVRDKLNSDDPLENYCNDSAEAEECRTYEN